MEEMMRDMYVVVTDYVKPNTGEDVSDALQELILANPNRTIFFPMVNIFFPSRSVHPQIP